MNILHSTKSAISADAGQQMIRSIDVRNFRCYRHLSISNCKRLNVIVGDNGTGKTALLESIFLPLASSSDIGLRLRQQRGLDGHFNSTPHKISEAIWGDFFHDGDTTRTISLILAGEGIESRSLKIARGGNEALALGLDTPPVISSQFSLTWRDSLGTERTVTPSVGSDGYKMPDTGERVDVGFFFPANQLIGSLENATRFSDLSKSNRSNDFISIFKNEYPWIGNISIEIHGGGPVLFAEMKGTKKKIPVPNISSGINRSMAIMLAIASSPKSVVLVDEIENGIHHAHLVTMWRSLISFLRKFDCQMFVSTHSAECISALVAAADGEMSDIALFQTMRGDEENSVRVSTGIDMELAVKYDEEMR